MRSKRNLKPRSANNYDTENGDFSPFSYVYQSKFMKNRFFGNQILAAAMILTFAVLSLVQARPMNDFFQQQDEKQVKKLPPVHFIRSRDYDMRHIALNLQFDWEKEQTYGTATITLAPLMPNLQTVNLDAGAMTINSVKLNGKDLKFSYDEPKTNLSINLDKVYGIGEALTFVVDYRTKGVVVA